MSSDLSWEHQFCLSCDRQTDGATYCSESCRLSEFEQSSTTSSPAGSAASSPVSSPGLGSSFNWAPPTHNKLACDLSKVLQSSTYLPPASSSGRALTPSSSQSSLSSMRSNSSHGNNGHLVSERAKQQLRDYASSFEHAQPKRHRS